MAIFISYVNVYQRVCLIADTLTYLFGENPKEGLMAA